MYLKQLDLLGFKSFANKITIHFSGGVTAIVGPNGCGKTNILDAIRWVLGEQKVSLLRGGKMEEVIFNGTRDVKPLGMSEVTMTLVNDRGVLPTDYNEVQVTRRLFRSGESEYLLNKVPCRLKDITELFYDTGVGAHSYSVIQPEMIEAVISNRADERRFLFEEAAGITKYKQRKKAALRKLEATEHDFLRLNDIYAEVKTQVNSLKRQYRKAERYQNVVNDIRNWEIYLNSCRLNILESEKEELKTQLNRLSDQRLDKEATLDRISAQLEADRKEQVDLEHKLSGISNEVYQASEQAHTCETEISVLTEKRSHAKSLIERNQNEIQSLQAREKVLKEQTTEAENELKQIKHDFEGLNSRLREAEEEQADADRQLLLARTAKEQENKKLIDLEGKLSAARTEGENFREQEDELKRLSEDLNNRITEKIGVLERLNEQVSVHQQTLDNISAAKAEAEKSHNELKKQIEQLVERSEELSLESSNFTASIEACQARCNLLEDMIVHYEGYESGVVATMEMRERFQEGLVGTVAEKFVPVEGLEMAVESALGEMAGFIICKDRPTAETIIDYLKTEKKGKIGILVPDTGTINPVVKRPELEMPEFTGWLDSFVSTDATLRPLMQAVLARTAVFKQGCDPQQILEQLPYGFKAVSTDGIVYSKNVITGGSSDRFPLFRRQEKVAEQREIVEKLKTQLSAVNQEKNKITAEIAAYRAESLQLSQTIETLTEEFESTKSEMSEIEFQRRSIDSDLARLRTELNSCNEKFEKIRSRQFSLGLDFSQLASQKEDLTHSMSQANKQLNKLEEKATAALEHVSQLQVEVVETKSKIEQIESKLSHIHELRQEITKTIEAKHLEIHNAEQEIEASTQKITELEQQLKSAFEQRTEVTGRQSNLRSDQTELLEHISTREKQYKEVRGERDTISDQIHQLEIHLNTLESEIKAVCDRVQEEFEVDIASIEPASPDEKLTEEQAHEHLLKQKEALKKIGPVNLLALEEYRIVSDREQFLKEQLADLTNAKTDLQTTITKINQTAKNLFAETFEKVRGNFKKLFVELFNGGEADIFLEDPSDPLESHIEIIARPGRKKLLSINQMSGGERALTAIGLLFSLYLVKPSPFCILDEIDAPLDDANCRRFLKLIETFSAQTQFIIITHNKITMEAADNLYGVTMEQPGISKLVAVRFADITRDKVTGTVSIDTETNGVLETAKDAPGMIKDDKTDLPEMVAKRLRPTIHTSSDPDNQD